MVRSQPPSVVLQVDDLPEDALLLGMAFTDAGIGEHFRSVTGAREALNYLEGKREFSDRHKFPVPCLLLLDVNMPGMDGFDVLATIRAHPQFKNLPVCMYSDSAHPIDIQRALDLGADAYIQKPSAFGAHVELARSIANTWFDPHPPEYGRPRILLRKRWDPRHGLEAGFFLQPDGSWAENRETARQFAHTVDARWWAKEQDYLKAEVVLAYPDPSRDYPCMKI